MKFLILASIVLSSTLWASEEELIQRTHFQDPERKILCLTEDNMTDPEIAGKAAFLKRIGAMDDQNCTNMTEDEIGFKKKIYKQILKTEPMLEVAIASRPNGRYEMILTPSAPADSRATTLSEIALTQQHNRSDYLKISAVVIGSVVIGNLASNRYYNNTQDKVLHAQYGGAMTLAATVGSTAAAFLLSDSSMSPKMKKLLIGCSGFMISTLAGITKEFMDMRDRTRNTVDAHDAIATSLGGGAGIGCAYSVSF